jgi:hypothetical protein
MTVDRTKALCKDPKDFTAIYVCPGCGRKYASRALAVACSEDNETPLIYAPGDLLVVDIGYAWYDGLERWLLLNQGREVHDKKTHMAYFRVTAVTYDDHRAHYHIKTLGIKNGHPTGLCGWTSSRHVSAQIVPNPDPKLIEESEQFIGEVYENLI